MDFLFTYSHLTPSELISYYYFYCAFVTLTVHWWRIFFVHISTYVRITVIEVTVPFSTVLATDVGISC